MDFTHSVYNKLLNELFLKGYAFQTFESFSKKLSLKFIVLRHDVDRLPENALRMAKLESAKGIMATYYFRSLPHVFNPEIILKIAEMGHEIGYHYEDLSIAKGDVKKAIEKFKQNLKIFRKIYPVTTICMHGSPLSSIDNRDIWQSYDYKQFGIKLEPYYDIDYSKVFYITDTGRKWNNEAVNMRDKPVPISNKVMLNDKLCLTFSSTHDIITHLQSGELPDKIIINTHPQRWFDPGLGWLKELVGQNIKNIGKRMLQKTR